MCTCMSDCEMLIDSRVRDDSRVLFEGLSGVGITGVVGEAEEIAADKRGVATGSEGVPVAKEERESFQPSSQRCRS